MLGCLFVGVDASFMEFLFRRAALLRFKDTISVDCRQWHDSGYPRTESWNKSIVAVALPVISMQTTQPSVA
ncbi:hypothetical protein V6N11_025099 [Hibiscus sabdariffa]|uniref:Uncharacterized protein n=1 Tax=Hibiscus sabdariffa TaxID=183260 RepID=A0ABR2QPA6_9ROSI